MNRFLWFLLLGLLNPLMSGFAFSQTLPQLMEAACTSHPTVRNVQAQRRVAVKNVESARWQFFPTPSVSVEAVAAAKDDKSYQGDAQVTYMRLQQPLWTGGRLTTNLEKSQVNVDVAQASIEDSQLQVALRVLQAYSDWWVADAKVQALNNSIQTHQHLLNQARNRITEGVSPASDLNLVQGRADATAADQAMAKLQRQQALTRMVELTGLGHLNHESLQAHQTSLPVLDNDLNSLLSQALSAHPGVRKALLQRHLAELQIAERQADLRPDVFIRAERQWGNYTINNMSAQNRLFIGLNSKLGAGLSNLSNLEAATEQMAVAQTDIESQERQLREQVTTDFEQIQSIAARRKPLVSALDSARTVFASFERQFNAGRKSWLDLMTAARELSSAEIQVAELNGTELMIAWRLSLMQQGITSLRQTNP